MAGRRIVDARTGVRFSVRAPVSGVSNQKSVIRLQGHCRPITDHCRLTPDSPVAQWREHAAPNREAGSSILPGTAIQVSEVSGRWSVVKALTPDYRHLTADT
jgi:hypothetical protein